MNTSVDAACRLDRSAGRRQLLCFQAAQVTLPRRPEKRLSGRLIVAVKTQELKLDIARIGEVSTILMQPATARACYVLAHGAGAGMRHASMIKIAEGLADRGIATFRFNFPYMENKQGRPDQP